MSWRPLDRFLNASIPKLHNLRRAQRAGFSIPAPTVWLAVADLDASPRPEPPNGLGFPMILRSGSPTEDTAEHSNAGRFVSLVVRETSEFDRALSDVVSALPVVGGQREGVVFAQPWVSSEEAGVTFFDGFYFEETRASGDNQALTSGLERGDVQRGHLQRGDSHHAWLARLHRLFGGRLDIEWTRLEHVKEPLLLQIRPALFPIRRNETLSLANHKEILGDPPSPWMVGILSEVSSGVMAYFARAVPQAATWNERYALELGERVWMNFSAFFQLMDELGLPRSMVTEGVGGELSNPLDSRVDPRRMILSAPSLIRLAFINSQTISQISKQLLLLDRELESAQTLLQLQQVNVRALDFSIRTNFAIVGTLSIVARVRRALGLSQAARVVTYEMMARYAELAALPDQDERWRALDDWLTRYGHRGPLESDPYQPRFRELRDSLRATLANGPMRCPQPAPRPNRLTAFVTHPFFVLDERREWFRDQLMRWWSHLRERVLMEAKRAVSQGHLESADDVFFLRSTDLAANPRIWRDRARERRERWINAATLELPNTASREALENAISRAAEANPAPDRERRFWGIGLGSGLVKGTAVRITSLRELLGGRPLPEQPILIASTLEPSWAIVFPRFVAVVADLGGELSHAAILLREAGIPSVLNARGSFAAIADGDGVSVDPDRGEVVFEPCEERRPIAS
jgi:phosphohistidine swiveling domain-containing protein